jgi:hypothetical protein
MRVKKVRIGLVELQEADKKISARVTYDKILLEVAVRDDGTCPFSGGARGVSGPSP